MKKYFIGLALILLQVVFSNAQTSPTRNQLLQLYHQANVAKKAANYDVAIATYGEIMRLVPQLPEPYLHVAKIYDENLGDDKQTQELAVFFYRKYIDVQLDEDKVIAVKNRLSQLESQMNVSHFEDYLKEEETKVNQEYAVIESEIENEIAQEDVIQENQYAQETTDTEYKTEDNSVEKEPKELKVDKGLTEEKPVKLQSKYKLLFPLQISSERSKSIVCSTSNIDPRLLKGRYVSGSRLKNNRETWILDIDIQQNEIRITINPNSGVLSLPQWQQGQLFERTLLQNLANNGNTITTEEDITSETMQMISNLQSKVASGNVKDDVLQFSYKIELNYNPSAGKYDWIKQCGNGLSSLGGEAGFLGGIFGGLLNSVADNAAANDTPIRYISEINFQLYNTPAGLIGTGRELLIEESDKGQHEKKNRVFNTVFYKVPDTYNGYDILEESIKSKEQIEKEKNLIKVVKKNSKDDSQMQYILAVLQHYSVGEKEVKYDSNKTYKRMLKAAKAGSINAIEYVIKYSYAIAANKDNNRAIRKKFLENAQEWSRKIIAINPATVKCLEAQYAIDSECDYDKALSLLKEAAMNNSGYAYNRLGELYLNTLKDADVAVDYFIKAVELGSNDATLNIAKLYKEGIGVNEDINEYFAWLVKGYEAGNCNAVKELADAYFKGVGVEQNYKRGLKYAELYAKRNNEQWRDILGIYKPDLLKIVE